MQGMFVQMHDGVHCIAEKKSGLQTAKDELELKVNAAKSPAPEPAADAKMAKYKDPQDPETWELDKEDAEHEAYHAAGSDAVPADVRCSWVPEWARAHVSTCDSQRTLCAKRAVHGFGSQDAKQYSHHLLPIAHANSACSCTASTAQDLGPLKTSNSLRVLEHHVNI
jgi:hypothetical protein